MTALLATQVEGQLDLTEVTKSVNSEGIEVNPLPLLQTFTHAVETDGHGEATDVNAIGITTFVSCEQDVRINEPPIEVRTLGKVSWVNWQSQGFRQWWPISRAEKMQ